MKLLIIILCLFSECFLIHRSSYSRFSWFDNYVQILKQKFPNLSPTILFVTANSLLLIILSLILILSAHILWGLLYFIFNLLIFYHCLGPDNPFYPRREDDNAESDVKNYLIKTNYTLFGVIFWYLLAGPFGVFIYRLLERSVYNFPEQAKRLNEIINWIPIKLTAFLYLVVGNYQQGIIYFKQKFFTSPKFNDQFLGTVSLLAGRKNEHEILSFLNAENTIKQALLVFLVLIALGILF